MLKVSVVVATYMPGDGLERLVSSLDAQTLSTTDFEVIFVDDGSPDDTYERLQKVAAARPHVRVERIENSGWPCKPRNIGTDLARGEYIAYADHDDIFYPDALRAAYRFAAAHGADVLNGKEARTHDAAWAIGTYRADVPNDVGRTDQHPLLPTNPHKMYRRAFLVEHGIRFPEDGRVYWEDVFFNVDVARHAKVISTLSSVPYYHWYSTAGSGSKGFLRSEPVWWDWLDKVLESTQARLDGPEHEVARHQMMMHQYRSRVLDAFNDRFHPREPAERQMIFDRARAQQSRYFDETWDRGLSASTRARAYVLRNGDMETMTQLTLEDPERRGSGHVSDLTWEKGLLKISAQVTWSTVDGRAWGSIGNLGASRVPVSEELALRLSGTNLDLTSEMAAATGAMSVRNRASRVSWMLKSEASAELSESAGTVTATARVRGVLDPGSSAFGRALEDGPWDFTVRTRVAGRTDQKRATTEIDPAAWTDGTRTGIAYSNAEGYLTVDLGQKAKKLVDMLRADSSGVRVLRGWRGDRVSVPLRDIEVTGFGELVAEVQLSSTNLSAETARATQSLVTVGAQIRALGERAELTFQLPARWTSARVHIGEGRPQPEEPIVVGRRIRGDR